METIIKKRCDGVEQRFHVSPLRPHIKKLYLEGFSSRKVAEKLGISHARVLQLLKKENISRRGITKRIPNKNYKKLNPDRAYIFGVMCGDGCVFSGIAHKGKWNYPLYVVYLAVKDKDFIDEFIKCIKEVYGVIPSVYLRERSKHNKNWSDIWIAKITRKEVYADLARYKFGTSEWSVPTEILNSNDEKIIGAFLRGFYDSEGSVLIGQRSFSVSVCSTNKRGLLLVKRLLEKLDIDSSNFVEDKRESGHSKTCFSFTIGKKGDLEIFLNKVGFAIQRKMSKLMEYINGA